MSFRSLFEDHPASVGETYWQHLASAWSFSWRMAIASLACLVHALLPFLCTKYGSQTITQLHDRMVINRHRNPQGMTEDATLQRERRAA